MRKIIIDTNFWLLPFERKIDFVAQIERLSEEEPFMLVVPKPVVDELKMMAGEASNKRKTRPARAALQVIEKLQKEGRLELVEVEGQADGVIITLALQTHAWVATNDRGLRERLREKKINNLVLKDQYKIDFE